MGLKVPHIHVTCTTESQISLRFALRPAVFGLLGHFETRALNDPQMTLNTKRSKVPHTCYNYTPESQISLRFALRPAIFELKTKRPKVPHIHIATTPESEISLLFRSTGS